MKRFLPFLHPLLFAATLLAFPWPGMGAQDPKISDDDTVNRTLTGNVAPNDAKKAAFVGTKQTSERRAKALAPIEDVPGLPRVLLIGDSISIGYTLATRELLAGKANVHRVPLNCGGLRFARPRIAKWLGDGKWDVIHYNTGLHDLAPVEKTGKRITDEQFDSLLREVLAKLEATKARVVLATITPLPPISKRQEDHQKLNEMVLKVAKENGLAVDDLYSWAVPRQREIQLPDDAHFSVEGYAVLAQCVAKSIEAALPAKP